MIQHESTIAIARPAADVFSFIADFQKAQTWLESCHELKLISGEPKAAGGKLHYTYDQGGHRGEMDGSITAYEQDRRLEMHFSDKMFEVTIVFACAPGGSGTEVTHSISIDPKSMMSKLMTPMIKAGNKKQVENNLARLKELTTA